MLYEVITCLGVVREVIGAGSLFGIDLFGPRYEPWVVMVLPAGGFLVLGAWLLLFEWLKQRKERAALEAVAEIR